MSKYIIDLPDNVKKIVYFHVGNANAVWTTSNDLDDLEVLNSDYINEHYGELQDEAYQKGINDGSLDVKLRVEGAYQRGLNDAWGCMKSIAFLNKPRDMRDFFGHSTLGGVLNGYTPSEAIAKLKAYEDKHSDRIEVGDEVIDKDGDTTIVTNIHERLFDGLCSDGSTMSDLFLEDVRKTGRHYDHIGKLLEAIRA